VDDPANLEERPATYREVFAERRFRVLFVARSIGIVAFTLRIFALSVLVFTATGSPLLSALTFGAGFLPQAIGGLLFGALADRVPPRRLITAGYTLEAGLAALVALLHLPAVWYIVMAGAAAFIAPVVNGAAGRLIAEILAGDAYVLGRAVVSMSASAAQLIGLAAGGTVVAALNPRPALVVVSGCALLAALIVRFGLPESAYQPRAAAGAAVNASLNGSRYLLADRAVRRLLLAQWLPPALAVGAEALLVPYAGERRFPTGAASLLLAALPTGMLVGDFVVGRFMRPALRERLSAPMVVLLGAPLLLLPLSPPLPGAVLLLLLSGTGFAYALGLQRPFLDVIPEAHLGLAFTLLSTGLMTVQGIGPLVAGVAAEFTSAAAAIGMIGVATMLTGLLARRPGQVGYESAWRWPGRRGS
jgi:predicted MFS family arabinose efflux permease